MFLLGLLATLQMAVLPGLLMVCGFRLCSEPLKVITGVFLLSALFNHLFVHISVSVGLLFPATTYILVALELLGLGYLFYQRGGFARLSASLAGTSATTAATTDPGPQRSLNGFLSFKNGVAIIALLFVLLAAAEAILRLGDTFAHRDTLSSWNRWATELAFNIWPTFSGGYPQLVPSNYALTYLFTQNGEVWFFAKFWISLFFPVLLLSLYQLYWDKKRWEIALAVPFTLIFCYQILGADLVYGGTADIALATFAFSALAALLRASSSADPDRCHRELLLGALFAVGAALTKQGGLYVLALYPLLAWAFVIRSAELEARKRLMPWVAILSAGSLLAVLPWYVREALSERIITADLLFDVHQGRDAWERLLHAWQLLEQPTFNGELLLVIALTLLSLAVPGYRLLTLLVALPYALIWALGFSYDQRNIALALPLFALSSAFGIGVVWRGLNAFMVKNTPLSVPQQRLVISAGLSIAVLVLLNSWFDPHHLQHWHNRALTNTARAAPINHHLIGYFREHPAPGKVLTHYYPMLWIPPLRHRLHSDVLYRRSKPTDWSNANLYSPKGLDWYLQQLESDGVQFVLFDRAAMPQALKRYLDIGVQTGEFEKLFHVRARFAFYRKLSEPKPETLRLATTTPADGEKP